MSYELRATSYELRATSYELQATSYKLQATSYKLQATSYKLQATSYKLQATSYKLQATLDWNKKGRKVPELLHFYEADVGAPFIRCAQPSWASFTGIPSVVRTERQRGAKIRLAASFVKKRTISLRSPRCARIAMRAWLLRVGVGAAFRRHPSPARPPASPAPPAFRGCAAAPVAEYRILPG